VPDRTAVRSRIRSLDLAAELVAENHRQIRVHETPEASPVQQIREMLRVDAGVKIAAADATGRAGARASGPVPGWGREISISKPPFWKTAARIVALPVDAARPLPRPGNLILDFVVNVAPNQRGIWYTISPVLRRCSGRTN